jgi:ectoine hydroxylase-related dioxygenase (phytanoyl-CoA dioxygenase family)
MYYFKPPGAKGQALHQDNVYLLCDPGTCYAAWTAIDATDPDNGGMYIVPGSHRIELECPIEIETTESFTNHTVPIPNGMKAIPVIMEPGDTLFFNGSVIHGSGPNRTKDRWRRSFITHYTGVSAKRISHFYTPCHHFDGRLFEIEENQTGGPCGGDWKGAVGY